MKGWQGSCIGAFLVLLICGGSLIFFVPFGRAMIAGIPPLFNKLTASVLCPEPQIIRTETLAARRLTQASPVGERVTLQN